MNDPASNRTVPPMTEKVKHPSQKRSPEKARRKRRVEEIVALQMDPVVTDHDMHLDVPIFHLFENSSTEYPESHILYYLVFSGKIC